MDYTSIATPGRASFELAAFAVSRDEGEDVLNAAMEDWEARAKRGGGRVDIRVVHVLEGGRSRMRVVPMRSSDSIVSDGLKRLGREIPSGTSVEQLTQTYGNTSREVERLLEREVVEIH